MDSADVDKSQLNVVPSHRLVQTAPTSANGSNNPEPKLDINVEGLPASDSESDSDDDGKVGSSSQVDRR